LILKFSQNDLKNLYLNVVAVFTPEHPVDARMQFLYIDIKKLNFQKINFFFKLKEGL